LQAIALNEPDRQAEAIGAITEREAVHIQPLVFAARLGQVCAVGDVEGDVREVDPGEAVLHVLRRHTARVQAADHRAHAGGCDAVDRNAVFLEHLQHAEMCIAARTAA
jgi:hypothetical protein